MNLLVFLVFNAFAAHANAFSVINSSTQTRTVQQVAISLSAVSTDAELSSPAPTPIEKVLVLEDADAVGKKIREIVAQEAEKAIAEKGSFAIAIPGGSILKMLAGDIENKEKWTSKTTLVYVNHKCVSMDDGDLATHAKARKLFLDEWDGVNAIVLSGSADGDKEAKDYEDQINALGGDILSRCPESGIPMFDLSLIGVGDDGHIGSLYPGREEVLVGKEGSWVLPVAMKEPPSITLSLPVMKGKKVVIAACGVSDKYPQGKSDGMRRAIVADDETLKTFPAVGLRDCATWVLDKMAASKLGDDYM